MDRHLPAQDAWTRARDRYIEDLTDDEKRRYDNASPETLLDDASAAQKKHEANSTGRNVMEKLQPLVSAIQQYGSALDVYSNAYPLVLSPLWGSIRVLLHLTREFNKYFEKIVDMFSRIGDVLPRFKVFERLFPNHERLIQALSVAYVDIIEFCSNATDVFRRGQRTSMTTFKVAFKLMWKPFERQFVQQMVSFRLHQKNVEKEAGLSHMIESADSRALVLANQMQLVKDKRAQDRVRIMALFPPVDHEAKHGQLVDLRHEGTGGWLIEHDAYMGWKGQQNSATLCVYGIPGCGKSVLASAVIDDLADSTPPATVDVVYYYCEYTDQRTLQPINLFGTFLKQLYAKHDIPEEIEELILQAYAHGTRSPSTKELVSILGQVLALRSRVVIVLDGLDECEKDIWREVVRAFERLVAAKTTVIQVFVTCVEESEVLRVLHHHPRIHASPSVLAGDIESFVAKSVQSRIDSGDLKIHDRGLQREIIDELTSKANGMFLWVYFQLNELCEALSDAMIREILGSLPDGLTNTYTRLLSKMNQGSLKARLVQKLFKWIACARRPLKVDEITEAVAFERSKNSLDVTKIPDEVLLIESCKGLVVRDPRDRTIRFAHHTVQQHLLSDVSDKSADFFCFRFHEADAWVGTLCVSYLRFSDFETQVTKLPPKRKFERKGLLESEGPLGIPSILGLHRSLLQIPYRLLGGKPAMKTLEIDYTNHVSVPGNPSANASVDIKDKYKLLDYVINHWEPHTRHSMKTESEKAIQDLAMYKTLPFEFRPWGENEHFGPYGCSSCTKSSNAHLRTMQLCHISLFNYATQVGNMVLLRPLFAHYHKHEGFETFLLACRHGQTEVIKYFMEHITYDISERRAVETAAKFGHLSTLKYFLDSLILRQHRAIYLGQAVYLAAEGGHDTMVKTLCDRGFNMYERDKSTGWDALEVAAYNGHDAVVRILLMAGFVEKNPWEDETQAPDQSHLKRLTTPLHLAAQNGHSATVRTLFELSTPDQTQKDQDGEIPLHKAAKTGNSAVVDALLENCGSVDKKALLETRTKIDNIGEIASSLAASNGHVDVLEVLWRHGFSINRSSDQPSMTEIELAAMNGHDATVRWLVHHGAGVNDVTSFTDYGPLHFAIMNGHDTTVRLLLDSGAIIPRSYPFNAAAMEGHVEVLQTLLLYSGTVHSYETRAYVNEALEVAEANGRDDAVQFLKSVLEMDPRRDDAIIALRVKSMR